MNDLMTAPGSRDNLILLLHQWMERHPDRSDVAQRTIDLVLSSPRAAYRDNFSPGHLTGSAWVLDPRAEKVLLLHHAKLKRWLQPGGHADGEYDLAAVALREASEESGLASLALADPGIFDIDIHVIPERGEEPEHSHFDVRFVVTADSAIPPVISHESLGAAWVPLHGLKAITSDESVLRMAQAQHSTLL
jgi:8-oxo-dGTP pyrophosphatase MutT (NUDIX family)